MGMPDSVAQALMGEIDNQLTKLTHLAAAIFAAGKEIKEAKIVTAEWRRYVQSLPKAPIEGSTALLERDTPDAQARRRGEELARQEARERAAALAAEYVSARLPKEIPNWDCYQAQQARLTELILLVSTLSKTAQRSFRKQCLLVVVAIAVSCALGITIGCILSK